MRLVLARCLEDPRALLSELQEQGRQGNLLALAAAAERRALLQAVLGQHGMERCTPVLDATAGQASRGTVAGTEPTGEAALAALPESLPIASHSPVAALLRQLGPALVLGSGGSSGGRRWCLQPLSHLIASADACAGWLLAQGIEPSRCLLLDALPLQHVSGLLPLLRAERWGAQLRWLPPHLLRQPEQLAVASPLPSGRPVLLSLVPTQLYRLLACPQAVSWLAGCAVIWVGGAALTADLAARARAAGLPLAPCYGATETAAMVCALPPARFLAGEAGCGPPLADVELRLEGAEQAIAVRSGRLSPGWFEQGRLQPFTDTNGWWRSGDAGAWIAPGPAGSGASAASVGSASTRSQLAAAGSAPAAGVNPAGAAGPLAAAEAIRGPGSLIIHGRLDGAIHSGGETVFPEQVRQQLLAWIEAAQLPVQELLLLGMPDPQWGEQLVALVRPIASEPACGSRPGVDHQPLAAPMELLDRLAELARRLPPPLRPRRWLPCPELETSATGKWERQRWQAWVHRTAPHPHS